MFGAREILAVGHCSDHGGEYSQDKTNKEMAGGILKRWMDNLK